MNDAGVAVIVLGLLLAAPVASSQGVGKDWWRNEAEWRRELSTEVWLSWAFEDGFPSREQQMTKVLTLREDSQASTSVHIRNDSNATIYNATLILQAEGVAVGLGLEETFAGGEPQWDLAHFAFVYPDGGWPVIVRMAVQEGQSGPFLIRAIMTFETASGEPSYALTELRGVVEPDSDPEMVEWDSEVSWAFFALGLMAGAAGTWAILRRKAPPAP